LEHLREGDFQLENLRNFLWKCEKGDKEIFYRICSGDRDPKIIEKRRKFIVVAYTNGYNKNVIAKLLNMTRRGVSIAISRNADSGCLMEAGV